MWHSKDIHPTQKKHPILMSGCRTDRWKNPECPWIFPGGTWESKIVQLENMKALQWVVKLSETCHCRREGAGLLYLLKILNTLPYYLVGYWCNCTIQVQVLKNPKAETVDNVKRPIWRLGIWWLAGWLAEWRASFSLWATGGEGLSREPSFKLINTER